MSYIRYVLFFLVFSFYFSITECENGQASGYPCSNVDLLSHLPLSELGNPSNANDIWGWTDPINEDLYAILGLDTGTAFIRITDPENPLVIGYLPTHSSASLWRDIKVYQNHAFIGSEAGSHGMQVFDLNQLRDYNGGPQQTFNETAHYGLFGNSHNIVINEETGFAYAVGTNDCSGGLHMINIQNPSNPTYAGCYNEDGYTHDTQCVIYNGIDTSYQGQEVCFSSNEDTITITNVTNKSNPQTISINGYNGAQYSHQAWLTEDHRYLLSNDELDEYYDGVTTRTYIWELNSLDNPTLLGYHDHGSSNIDHNLYVEDNFVYQSHYTAGLRIHDISDIANAQLTEVAFFDIHPENNGTTFDGTWSNYPFFDNNIVIVSGIGDAGNIESGGLFVLQFNEPAYPELSIDYNEAILETTLDEGALIDYQLQISNTGEEQSTLSFDVTSSAFLDPLGSDNSGNSWSSSNTNYEWIDILDESTTVSFVNNDSANGTIPIGFNFPLYGNDYSICSVNPNGWLGFGGDSNEWDNSQLPTNNLPAALLPFWDDLNPVNDNCNESCAGDVYYYSSSEMFVVTFDQVAHWPTNFADSYYTFQVVMYPDGRFNFNYLNLNGTYDSATIGMQNQNGTDGILMSYNSDAVIENNLSISVANQPTWIELTNSSGELEYGQTSNVNVTLNATNLSEGNYFGYLLVNTNASDISIPLNLIVSNDSELLGDINGDGSLNIQDVIIIVTQYILISEYNEIADLNGDGSVNIQDIIMLVGIITG